MTSSLPDHLPPARYSSRPPGFSHLGPLHYHIRMVAVVLLLLVTGLAGGMVLERYVVQGATSSERSFPDLEAVAGVIDESYYYRPTSEEERERLDRQMEQQAIIGALSSLDDEYTRYLEPDLSATALEDLEGRYGGTGVDVVIDEGVVVVANVVADSPADEAGIQRGDVIERIDNQPVDPGNFDGIVRQLRGEVGTSVALSLTRPETGEALELELVREEIVVPPVTLRMIDGTSIGWLRITIFGNDTLAEVEDAIRTLEQQGATGIILDLRGNSGGWVTSAQGVLGRFLNPDMGPALYEDTSPDAGEEIPLPILRDENSPFSDLPMVVLVDRGTASAAEIVAGALKDYGRAVVVGEQTYGKGSVQRIFSFDDGATLRVTVAEWFTPSMGRIQQQGIQPDIEVTAEEHASTGGDPALGRAVAMLQSGDVHPGTTGNSISSASATPDS
jgi:carboxyl-terminal processing protease